MIKVLPPPPEALPPEELPPHAARPKVATATSATTRIGFAMPYLFLRLGAPGPVVLAPIERETTTHVRTDGSISNPARPRLRNDSDTPDRFSTHRRMQDGIQITSTFPPE